MNKSLIKRLNECNISIEDILKNIEKGITNLTIFIYTSHLEGLGTKNSDFDVYVISRNISDIKLAQEHENYKVKTVNINKTQLDIEYWTITDVYKLIERVNELSYTEVNMYELKLLHRLRIGEIINGLELGKYLKGMIENSKLKELVLRYYIVMSNSWLQDAVKMYKSGEFICAINCAHSSLEYAIGAFNAKKGITVVKPKWIFKSFISQQNNDNNIIDGYFKYQIYSNINADNIESFVEEKLEFIQNILSIIAVN